MSPPLRSGACNPLAHQSAWQAQAQQASKLARSSLEALQTRGRGPPPAAAVRGDLRVLLSPPDASVLAAYCVDPAEPGAGGGPPPAWAAVRPRARPASASGGSCGSWRSAGPAASPGTAQIFG